MKRFSKELNITLLALLLIVFIVVIANYVRLYLTTRAIAQYQSLPGVSTQVAKVAKWTPSLYAVGTLSAINGVALSPQAAGNVVAINFESGQRVKKNDVLIQIDDRQEQAQLQNNLAAMKLAEITYQRNKTLVTQGAVSNQAYDESIARYQQAAAAVAGTQAIIAYKHITAPFEGKIGIRNVNLGQYVKPGDNLVYLESLNPLYVNFTLPEQYLHQLQIKQRVVVTVDGTSGQFTGYINAIDALIDVQTHNILVQATIDNNNEKLYPGLFARVHIMAPKTQQVVVVPLTAINFSLYGNSIFVLKKTDSIDDAHPVYTLELRVVTVGEQQNNQAIILKGIKPGEWVVTSGQLKLTPGQKVIINNSVPMKG